MPNPYCYVVFAPGTQPSLEEVELLDQCVARAKQRYAVGVNADNGCLALAFETQGYRRDLSSLGKFARLVQHWQDRGCQVQEKLAFIKNPGALQPLPAGFLTETNSQSSDKVIKQKELAAQEALGQAGLKLYSTLQKHSWIQRMGGVFPYLMMGLGGILVIVAGLYVGQRLSNSSSETRQEMIERVAKEAMQEQLTAQSKEQVDSPKLDSIEKAESFSEK